MTTTLPPDPTSQLALLEAVGRAQREYILTADVRASLSIVLDAVCTLANGRAALVATGGSEVGPAVEIEASVGMSDEDAVTVGRAALDAGGVIFISAHLGDWEALLTYHQRLDRELLLLSKRLSNPLAQALWDRSRSGAPRRLDQGARARQLIEHLKSGGCVADVLDQHDPRAKARRLLFFGREASTSP